MRGLNGKVILVAGAGSGIGAATALRLCEEGARVVVGDLDEDAASRTASMLTDTGGEAIGLPFDITDEESNRALVAAAVARFGALHGVHVNAADMTTALQDANVVDLDIAVFDRLIEVNLRGHYLLSKAAIPALLASVGGAMLYTGSAASFVGIPAFSAYPAAKLGLSALVRHVAATWGREGVRANGLAPGLVLSETMLSTVDQDGQAFALAVTPSPRLGKVDDIAAAAAFLLSDDAAWINGQVISVDGGATMR